MITLFSVQFLRAFVSLWFKTTHPNLCALRVSVVNKKLEEIDLNRHDRFHLHRTICR